METSVNQNGIDLLGVKLKKNLKLVKLKKLPQPPLWDTIRGKHVEVFVVDHFAVCQRLVLLDGVDAGQSWAPVDDSAVSVRVHSIWTDLDRNRLNRMKRMNPPQP